MSDSVLLLYQIFHSSGFCDDDENEEGEILELLKGLFITENTTFAPNRNDDTEAMVVYMIPEEKTWKNIGEEIMLRNGYEWGKGLGSRLQGIIEPI